MNYIRGLQAGYPCTEVSQKEKNSHHMRESSNLRVIFPYREGIFRLSIPYPANGILLDADVEGRARGRDFDDGRPVQDHGVHDRGVGLRARDEGVGLAHRRRRDDRGDHVALHSGHDRGGVQSADEDDVARSWQAALDAEGEGHTRRGGHALGGCQCGEGLDGEGDVGGGAGLDEGGGHGVDVVQTQRSAVGVGGTDLAEVEALNGGVEGFGDEDGAGDVEIFL